MKIIGLNSGEFNSSACLLINGKIVYAVQEERLIREKFTKKFPKNAIKKCLDFKNLDISDIDYISVGWNPSAHMSRFNPIISSNRTYREYNFYTLSDNLFSFTDRSSGNFTKISHDKTFPEIYHVNHHLSHAGAAFYLSNFTEAAILTCDFKGENQCTTWGFGKKNKIKILDSQNLPNSLGLLYATFTSLLGYKPDSDEWKVMAMSAYKTDCSSYINKIKKLYKLSKNGKLELNQKYFGINHLGNNNYLITKDLMNLFDIEKINYQSKPDLKTIKIAKALQICAEEIALHMINYLYKVTKCKNLVLGGGFFMNSVLNGKIEKKTKFKESYISFAPSDTGNSIGSALYLYHNIKNKNRKKTYTTAFLGPKYDNEEILKVLNRRNIKFTMIKNFAKDVAYECHMGKIVGYFRNKLEFGDRSLGCRSILADPRPASIKSKINFSIKYRENYRPFAPSVISEKSHIFFNNKKNYKCNFMEKVINVRKKYANKLKAITHVDNSARVHTVNKNENNDFYKILKEFEKLTSYPILLNTSFNINGEPIVCSPDDAISTFYNSKIDVLFLGDYKIKR